MFSGFFACSNNAAINNLLYTSFGKKTNISKGDTFPEIKLLGERIAVFSNITMTKLPCTEVVAIYIPNRNL